LCACEADTHKEAPLAAGIEHAEGGSAAQVAHEVLAAIVEGRVADVLALTDQKVTCLPVTRPALSMYEGHAAIGRAGR
jgi:hypothetical protein